mmetsp:Transcript_29781/g.62698  ORF Transcript_29781/g.62698 Transcript_29781/m.62698 type:complete len:112 (-) Transcript_29781:1028-1363(-)
MQYCHEQDDSKLSEKCDLSKDHHNGSRKCCESCRKDAGSHMSQSKMGAMMSVDNSGIHRISMADMYDKITTDTNQNGEQNRFQESKLPTKTNKACRRRNQHVRNCNCCEEG